MKLDHHEKIFRKTLQEHHVPLDTRTLWSQIESSIESEKEERKPFFLWWIFGGLLVLTLLIAGYFVFNRLDFSSIFDSQKPTSTTELTKESNPKPTKSTAPTTISSLSERESMFVEKGKQVDQKLVNTKEKNVDQVEIKKENNVAQAPSGAQIGEAILKNASPDISIEKESIINIAVNNKPIVEKNESRSKADQKSTKDIMNTVTQTEELPSDKDRTEAIHPKYIDPLEELVNKPTITRAKQAFELAEHVSSKNEVVSEIENIELQELVLGRPTTAQQVINNPLSVVKKNMPRWSLFASAGLGTYTFKNSNLETNIANPSISRINNLKLKRQFQNVELGVDFRLSPSFSIQTGVSYTRFISQTRFNNVYEVASITSDGVSNVFFVNDTFDTTSAAYAEFESVRQINETVNKNLYRHYFDIPLTVAYQRSIGNRWNIGASVGALINFSQATTGSYIGVDNQLITFRDVDALTTSSESGSGDPQINYHAGLVIGYDILPTFQVFAKPTTKYIRNFPSTESESGQSIWAYGLNLGVQMSIK